MTLMPRSGGKSLPRRTNRRRFERFGDTTVRRFYGHVRVMGPIFYNYFLAYSSGFEVRIAIPAGPGILPPMQLRRRAMRTCFGKTL
ncbi:hypothetical protein OKW33_008000 [Paraburkholderia atlantica]|uniref:hypothetical protein n=1 Tax=Paraburkholderia atlantica TaxID=2654982 RepID=UPI003D1BE990